MTVKDLTQLPLWEHAAESGRFAEYVGAASGLQSWNLVGKGVIFCLTMLGGVVDVLHLGTSSSRSQPNAAEIAAVEEWEEWIVDAQPECPLARFADDWE